MQDDYRFQLEMMRETGESLGHIGITPDWDPAIEWTRWLAFRTGRVWAGEAAERGIEPVWHRRLGKPIVELIRVQLAGSDGAWCQDLPATPYFAEQARTIAAGLVESGVVAVGHRVRYRVAASVRQEATVAASRLAFDAADAAQAPVLRATSLAPIVNGSVVCGEADVEDYEVFLPRAVIDDVTTITARAGDSETGGILIGYLHRDPVGGEIFGEVTAQIPARHTQGTAQKLTFTSDTWTDVRAALTLRRRDELMLGWWHSHPAFAWCKDCPEERQRTCRLATGFLSIDDKALHRAMFPRAFTLALLMTHAVTGVSPRLFGWRRGVMTPRAFRVTGSAQS